MKLLMIGPQGAGKGTIGTLLSKELGLPLVSSGNLLRDISKSHPRYEEITNLLSAGKLAPFEVVTDLLVSRLSLSDCKPGYILDGWARSMENLSFFNPGFDHVIYITIPQDLIMKRLSTRRTCSQCGAIYNVVSNPPKVEGVCDVCGGTLVQRTDDTPESIQRRLDIFNKETIPVIEHFKSLGILHEIDGEGLPTVVLQRVLSAIRK